MQAVVLAAGEGTRMRPLTDRRPKPMLPVGDRPLVAHTVGDAVAAGATRIVLVVGYGREAVEDYFGTEYDGVPVEYAVQERQAGTADAVLAARDHLAAAPFAVLNGDSLYDRGSLTDLFGSVPAVGAYRVDRPSSYGVFELDGDRVADVEEKPDDPPSNVVNAGGYVFPAAARDWLDVPESQRGERELTDVLSRTIERESVRAVELDRWLDVGRPWELLAANEWKVGAMDRRIDGEVHDDTELRGDVVVERGATVDSGVVVEGPALVRSGASLGPNAYVRGTTAIGEEVTVGHAVEVKNSVLMAGASAGHLSYVGDSVVGRDANLGAGTQIANLRHDGEDVRLTVKGERVSTGRRKFGVVLGDDAKTGINTSLNAGVTLSTGTGTTPGESVTRDR